MTYPGGQQSIEFPSPSLKSQISVCFGGPGFPMVGFRTRGSGVCDSNLLGVKHVALEHAELQAPDAFVLFLWISLDE